MDKIRVMLDAIESENFEVARETLQSISAEYIAGKRKFTNTDDISCGSSYESDEYQNDEYGFDN